MNNNNQANHQPHLTWWGRLYYGLMLMEILYKILSETNSKEVQLEKSGIKSSPKLTALCPPTVSFKIYSPNTNKLP